RRAASHRSSRRVGASHARQFRPAQRVARGLQYAADPPARRQPGHAGAAAERAGAGLSTPLPLRATPGHRHRPSPAHDRKESRRESRYYWLDDAWSRGLSLARDRGDYGSPLGRTRMATIPLDEAFEDTGKTGTSDSQFVLDLDGYEGPIDVLLNLARDQKVDLTKISILDLADQYLSFVARARRLRLELAADYLVMAAGPPLFQSPPPFAGPRAGGGPAPGPPSGGGPGVCAAGFRAL